MKKNILYVILAIILIGIIVTCILGFNVDMIYSKNKQIDIYIGKTFENEDINNIVKEVIGENKEIKIQKVELYEDMVSITAKEITDEQIEQINQKINEKYEIENKIEDIDVTNNSNVKLIELVKPYVVPTIISAIIVIGYEIIRFKNIKTIAKISLVTILAELLYYSIIVITRQGVNRITIPAGILVAILVLFIAFFKQEQKY